MANAGKIIAVVLVAVGLGGLIYWGVTSKAKVNTEPETVPDKSPSPPVDLPSTNTRPITTQPVSSVFPLTRGMSGNTDVKKMQQALISKFAIIISAGATGNFGEQTAKALMSIGYSGDFVTQVQYRSILEGFKNGQDASTLLKLNRGDKIIFTVETPVFSSYGYGEFGKVKSKAIARYDAPEGGGWSKVTITEYYVKGAPDPESGKDTWVYKFNQRPAYVRTYTFKKK